MAKSAPCQARPPLTPARSCSSSAPLGVSATQTRTAAFRQLVLQALAPVVAHAFGNTPGTATQHVFAAGGTWNRYPATRAGN